MQPWSHGRLQLARRRAHRGAAFRRPRPRGEAESTAPHRHGSPLDSDGRRGDHHRRHRAVFLTRAWQRGDPGRWIANEPGNTQRAGAARRQWAARSPPCSTAHWRARNRHSPARNRPAGSRRRSRRPPGNPRSLQPRNRLPCPRPRSPGSRHRVSPSSLRNLRATRRRPCLHRTARPHCRRRLHRPRSRPLRSQHSRRRNRQRPARHRPNPTPGPLRQPSRQRRARACSAAQRTPTSA